MAGRFLLLSESLLPGTRAVMWFWAPSRPFCNAEDRGVSQVAVAHPINKPLRVMPQQELSDRVVPLLAA
jgi:hypothetical protein